MPDVAEALVLPDVGGPDIASFLSALLVWDRPLVVPSDVPGCVAPGLPS
jgi:hypothetical protein